MSKTSSPISTRHSPKFQAEKSPEGASPAFGPQLLTPEWFARSALEVAPDLIGCRLAHRLADGTVLRGVIVETEAYLGDDPASHSYLGPTSRNATMFGPPGLAYVYFIYGMYHCLNVVTGREGEGEAVLLRAVDFRPAHAAREAAGPGKLCRLLRIDRSFNGVPLFSQDQGLWLEAGESVGLDVEVAPRVGISKAAHHPWRWFLRENPCVSTHRRKSAK